ncbi:MAG: WG repeat-containing protein [Peptococcaceae bacterium]|nr:WG repeat-containing protein [Peptococcaceae bacterium]
MKKRKIPIMTLLIMILAVSAAGAVLGIFLWPKDITVVKLRAKYDAIDTFHNGVAIVERDHKKGLIDTSGHEVVAPMYTDMTFIDNSYTWLAVEKGGSQGAVGTAGRLRGVIDTKGKIVFPLEYDFIQRVSPENDFLCMNRIEGKICLINSEGLLAEISGYYDVVGNFFEDRAYVSRSGEGKYGYIDTAGNRVIPFEYNQAYDFNQSLPGLALVRKEIGEWAYIDTAGDVVMQLEYDWVDRFSGGRARVERYDGHTRKYGYIDTTGKEVIPLIYEDNLEDYKAEDGPLKTLFSENGFAAVYKNGKWGYIDTEGHVVVPFEYENTYHYNEDKIALVQKNGKWGVFDLFGGQSVLPTEYDDIAVIAENLKRIRKGNKFGVIDADGNIILPVEYDFVFTFSEFSEGSKGLAAVQKDGKWGYIDAGGVWVVPLEYDSVSYYVSEGLAAVQKDGKWGCVDIAGHEVIPLELEYEGVAWHRETVEWVREKGEKGENVVRERESSPSFLSHCGEVEFMNGYARVARQGRIGMIDTQGKEVVSTRYDWINDFNEGYAAARIGDDWYILQG